MKFFKRLLLSLLIALPLMGFMLFVTQAKADDEPVQQPASTDCATCHAEVQTAWESGKHAESGQTDAFIQDWNAQGKPSACLECHSPAHDAASASTGMTGVTCEACHGTVSAEHPMGDMPVAATDAVCAKCHSDPRFGNTWAISAHYQNGMPCSTCHDPHTAGFKTVPGEQIAAPQNPSALCRNCHKDITATSEHSKHTQRGVACVDCHLGVRPSDPSDPHATASHSFKPTIETCNACHSSQMHSVTGSPLSPATDGTTTGGALASQGQAGALPIEAGFASSTPSAVSPVGYAAIALLIGVAGGFALSPLLDRSSRRSNGGK